MMLITKKQFRLILVLQVGLIILSALTPFVMPGLLTGKAAEFYQSFSEPDLTTLSVVIGVLSIPYIVWVIQNTLALYNFKSYAPRHLLQITIIGIAFGIAFDPLGVLPVTGIESMIVFVYTMLGGATLALVYTSNVASFFETQPTVDEIVS